jgi:murein DD-endopeptidase MepM/ murein hydrolase activator NlpD
VLFKPAQVQQGGMAVVTLTAPATAATLTFLGRQYRMLPGPTGYWAIVGIGAFTQPGQYAANISYTPAAGGSNLTASGNLGVADKDYPIEYIELAPSTAALLAPDIVQAEINQRASIYGGYTTQRLWSGPFVQPNAGPLSSRYGEGRSYNGAPVTDYHRGTDFVANTGSPVVAAARGLVAFTGQLQVRGGTVIIDHGAGVYTAYNHLSAIDVAPGQAVLAGQRIGLVGETGLVTGPHLHWEVVVRGVEVDGLLWLQGVEIGP